MVENSHNVNAWKEFSMERGIENPSITKLQASHGIDNVRLLYKYGSKISSGQNKPLK